MLRLLIIFIIFCNLILNQAFASKDIFKIDQNDQVYGSSNAPITIYEYSSLTCVHCASFHKDVFLNFKKNYIDKNLVRWVRRDFISDRVALQGTKLLHCVPKDKYELFLKILFDTQDKWAYSKDFDKKLDNLIHLANIDRNKYNQCMINKKLEEQLIAKTFDIKGLIEGTPAIFINGKLEKKLYSYDSLKHFITKHLPKN